MEAKGAGRILSIVMVAIIASLSLAMIPQLHQVQSKFEYRHSFKGPYLINSKGEIPFWTHGGSAIASEEQLRVCPSIKSRRGWAWSRENFAHHHWMIDLTIRIAGRMKNGADGMAVWFTEEPGREGPMFGNADSWKGLAVILDSFDNDGMHDNPKIQVILNDGSMQYEHASDGSRQESGSCLREFRNRPHPVKLKIVYLRGTLEVWVHDGLSLVADDYELCVKVVTDKIPAEGYFGVSAATGGLSDDHDVLSFITHSLTPNEARVDTRQVDEKAFQEAEDLYKKRSDQFDEQRRQAMTPEPDWQYELELEQNVRAVVDMQARLRGDIQQLSIKLDQLLMTDGKTPSGPVATTVSADIAHIKNTENNILHQLADLRSSLDRAAPSGAPAAVSEQLQPVYETKNMVQQNALVLKAIEQHLKNSKTVDPDHQCPTPSPPTSCVTPYFLVVAMVLQVAGILGYMVYRQAQEQKAKKFF